MIVCDICKDTESKEHVQKVKLNFTNYDAPQVHSAENRRMDVHLSCLHKRVPEFQIKRKKKKKDTENDKQ